MRLGRDRVVGVRVVQLRHAADVAGMQARHLDPFPALRDREMVEFHRAVARGVVHLLPGRHGPAERPEKRDVADMRLGGRLEHERRERRVVVGMNLDGLAAFGALEGVELLHLVCVRHEGHEEVQHGADADHQVCRTAEDREEILALHRFLQRGHLVFAGNLLAAEEALEQLVVGRGHGLDHFGVIPLEPLAFRSRNVGFLVLTGLS